MQEDIQLVLKLKHGSEEALCRIYEKYNKDMLGLAIALSNNKSVAEDVVHDVFVSFAESVERIELKSKLRSYLLACVANRLRNLHRVKQHQITQEEVEEHASSEASRPENVVMAEEISQRINNAMAHLPYEQQEVVIMHLQGELKFKEIAKAQGVSVGTVQSRYLYGLRKLRSLLNSEMEK
jgi:RNA polymerase sigma-70 factor (ECF subfamily)